MVWLGVCSKGVSPLVIFESDTLDYDRYIKEVLPVALKYGNDMFEDDWTQRCRIYPRARTAVRGKFWKFMYLGEIFEKFFFLSREKSFPWRKHLSLGGHFLKIFLSYGEIFHFSGRFCTSDWTSQQDGVKAHIHEKSQEWCAKNFSSFIDKDHWPPNSPDLNPLGSCVWNGIAQVIKWNAVTSKKTLIVLLKRTVKKISNDVLFESCLSWTDRSYRMSQDKGNYLK